MVTRFNRSFKSHVRVRHLLVLMWVCVGVLCAVVQIAPASSAALASAQVNNTAEKAAGVITSSTRVYLPCVMRTGPAPITNLLANGGFETGSASPWQGVANSQIVTADKHSGQYAVKTTGQQVTQAWISVTPGKTYVFSGWFKWVRFSGDDWGYDHFRVFDSNWKELASVNLLHERYEQNQWNKIALTFVATTGQVGVEFGVFGPQEMVEIYFDDLALFEKAQNLPPTINPTASTAAGNAPLTVSFRANWDDPDGAVQYFEWDFGDGSVETRENPTHTFLARGAFEVTLRAWDNDRAPTSKGLIVQVSDPPAPFLAITSPTQQGDFMTSQSTVTLAGTANAPNGVINRLVWDNVSTGDAGILNISPAANVSWTAGPIRLKPGKNEIILTTTDSRDKIATARIMVTRTVAGPQISNVTVLSQTVRVYEKYEVRFTVDTVADNLFFQYDAQPPPGVPPGSGVTVEGVFKTPSGATRTQPGFWARQVQRIESGGAARFQESAKDYWAVRFSPQEPGEYQVSLRVTDASGTISVPVGRFTALSPVRPGFIKVSQADSRYFEFSNGNLYWPIGPAWGPDYAQYKDTGQNLERPWMAGIGAYSTNFARWMSTAKQLGNEGHDSQLSFKEHYPSHELSQEIFYPEGRRIWISCWLNEDMCHRLKANTDYLIKIRLKAVNVTGPVDPGYPYGLMIKTHGWPTDNLEQDLRPYPSLIPPVAGNKDWHTIVMRYRTQARDADADISLFLDNVSSGRVYVDEFSVREILSDGSLGGEQIRDHRADLHLMVQQRPAAFFDWQIEQGEQNSVFFKYVIQDKRDWVQNHLADVGIFTERGDGYYQRDGTKAKWLQQQWWRYLIARWGYSTAVHSWELNNEGPPDDPEHYRHAQDLARFMHTYDAHPHLVTTSFWCCWRPEFWGDHTRYPDIDYADIHKYTDDERLKDGTLAAYDMAAFQSEDSLTFYASRVGKPVMRGETGIGDPSFPYFDYLSQPNPGIFYHNLLWAQLNAGGLSDPNYWWSQHLNQIDRAAISRPFYLFVRDLNINKGGYVDVTTDATVSNSKLRIYGQKNLARGQAHLWVQNKDHTWRNVMGVDNPTPISPQSGAITLVLSPNKTYTVQWWNTYTGQVTQTQTVTSNSAGQLTLTITRLMDDVAVKITPGS